MGGMEGGGCVACTKSQGCKGLHQGNEELLRLSTVTQGDDGERSELQQGHLGSTT